MNHSFTNTNYAKFREGDALLKEAKPESQATETSAPGEYWAQRSALKTDPILIEDLSAAIDGSRGSVTTRNVLKRNISHDGPSFVQIIEGDQDEDEKEAQLFSDNDISLYSNDEKAVLETEDNQIML